MHESLILMGYCPGQEEEKNGRPFIGDTGNNLGVIVEYLHNIRPESFPSGRRDDYTLMNADATARYVGKPGVDGGYTPTKAEVLNKDNVERIQSQIAEVEAVKLVFVGASLARWLSDQIRIWHHDILLYAINHPSPRSVNRWMTSYNGRSFNTKLQAWARYSFTDLQEPLPIQRQTRRRRRDECRNH